MKSIFNPGKEITLESGLVVTVYPLGFRHIQKFNQAIANAISVAGLAVRPGMSEKEMSNAIIAQMIPHALTHLLDLFKECVSFEPKEVSIDDLSHWELPALMEAWIMESFGDPKKYRPWIDMMKNLLLRFTGKTDLNQISGMLSKPSSAVDIMSKKS